MCTSTSSNSALYRSRIRRLTTAAASAATVLTVAGRRLESVGHRRHRSQQIPDEVLALDAEAGLVLAT